MPIYDFHCDKCKKNFEIISKISDSDKVKCPKCGFKLKRITSSKMNFKLVYDPKKHSVSWGNEGYSTTQYNRMKDGK